MAENEAFVQVVAKSLPAGSWAVVATVNTVALNGTFGPHRDTEADMNCQLRNGNTFIGGATSRLLIPESDESLIGKRSLAMNGGAFIPAGGGVVSLWCNSQFGLNESVNDAQIMMMQVGGFS